MQVAANRGFKPLKSFIPAAKLPLNGDNGR